MYALYAPFSLTSLAVIILSLCITLLASKSPYKPIISLSLYESIIVNTD